MSRRTKCEPEQYIQFLIASPLTCSATEAARVASGHDECDAAAHDSYRRLLLRQEPSSDELWQESRSYVLGRRGILIIDDSTLEKPHSKKIELVRWFWCGNQHRVVQGISLVTLLWSDGDTHIPCDYRVVDPNVKLTKNDLFQEMLRKAHARGVSPEIVCFDGWYSGIENLKLIRELGWRWLTRLKSNRIVSVERDVQCSLASLDIPESGRTIHLRGYGQARIFRIVSKDGDATFWATNDIVMSELERIGYAQKSWRIEEYHRGIKQFCGIKKCPSRLRVAQLNHIGFALRAFLRLERYCVKRGISWFQAKHEILRDAVRTYLKDPSCNLA